MKIRLLQKGKEQRLKTMAWCPLNLPRYSILVFLANSLVLNLKQCGTKFPFLFSVLIFFFVPLHVLSMAACQMSQSCLTMTCYLWSHACSKPLLHVFILDRSFTISHSVNMRVYTKSCLHPSRLKCTKIYYKRI